MTPVGILAVSHYTPERVLTNKELEKKLDTTDEWIRTRTGIHERRVASDTETTASMGTVAAFRVLEKARCSPEELDLIIVATMTPDSILPAISCRIQAELGAKNAGAFDVSIACSGFAYALALGCGYVKSGMAGKVLVVGADVMTRVMNWQDRGTCVLFGDGAGAALIGAVEEGYGLLAQELGSDGRGAEHLKIPAGAGARPMGEDGLTPQDFTLQMNGREVFRFAVQIMGDAALRATGKAGLSPGEIDLFIPHQANSRIIEAATKRLGLPKEKVFINLQRYGNTSCASIPLALSEALDEGRIHPGDNVVLVGFGGGLAWGALVFRWGGVTAPAAKAVPE
jgi:3-oxoacyl-[acyl-carrier-protein] synthase III